MSDNPTILLIAGIASVVGGLVTKLGDLAMKWYASRQATRRQDAEAAAIALKAERADSLAEAYKLLGQYKKRLEMVEKRLDECQEEHAKEMAARERGEAWMVAMQDALRRAGVTDFPPFPANTEGSKDHKPLE